MSLSGEGLSPSVTVHRRDADLETSHQTVTSETSSGDGRGVVPFSASQSDSISALLPQSPGNEREWNRVGDFITGRYDSSQGLWSASGVSRQFPMVPVIDRFMDSEHSHSATGYDPSYLSTEDGLHRQNIRLSSRLPRHIWFLLAKSLGIKLQHGDKPIFATILHIFTLVAAMAFAIPGGWYTVYDIRSNISKTTVLIGSVQIIIGFGWACMGVYAHNLAGRLFSNKNFVECVRVHSKTFLKISTSWLTLILGALVVVVNCYEASPIFYDDTCGTAQIEILVCQVFFVGRVVYAAVTLLWNFIVAYVLFSVCRTHTIGIRRFIRELNIDAKLYEDSCLRQYNIHRNSTRGSINSSLEESWYLWDDTNNTDAENDVTLQGVFLRSVGGFSNRRRLFTYQRHSLDADANREREEVGERGGDDGVAAGDTTAAEDVGASINSEIPEKREGESREESTRSKPVSNMPTILTNEDLIFSYWKFLRRLCVTSRYLQRWLASWIAFVLMWDGYFVIYWTSHNASLVGILQFIVPLLLLLLVCSAYAEVNAEGQRLLRMICPLQERLAIIFYFNQQPLAVRVFSFTVTYNAMVTVILGFSVAFASRMILDEISRN